MHDLPRRFGNFEWRPATRQVLRDGTALAIGARAYDVLAALIDRRDRTVSKSELIDIVWPDVVVEENNLQVQVSGLRKLLGAQAIATIPGRGYRFTLPAADDVSAPVPDPSPAGQPSTQPPAAGPLIGRDADLASVHALLQAHAVVTIVGAGGVGKTRLAHAAMARAEDLHPDGRWWVELAALNDPGRIPATIAAALALVLLHGRPPLEGLGSALSARRGLLVLDNCEHLADGVAAVVDALRAQAPGVHLLVTSQESLKCADEHVFRLGSLGLPPPHHADGVAGFGAVDLFVARARAVAPSFRLASDNVAAVVAVLPPAGRHSAGHRIGRSTRADARRARPERAPGPTMFSLLTGVSRVTLRRHQTLRAALEWSHDLLSDDERALLRRLGVFNGGFGLEMAQQVASDDRMDPWQVLDLLGQLIDKSLVIVEGDDTVPRYRMLEPTRAFALEQLVAAGESASWLERHARAVLSAVSRFEGGRWTEPTAELFRGARELGNLRAAVDWALSPGGDRGLAYALLGKGWGVFQVGGAIDEACAVCARCGRRRAAWRLRSRPRTAWRSCEAAVPRRRTSSWTTRSVRSACSAHCPTPSVAPKR